MSTKSVLEITLTNFLRHKHVAVKTKGNSFMLIGKNKAGKSSILTAIDHMISQAPMPADPVTDGEDAGEIEILLTASGNTYRVRRKFDRKKLGRYELHRDVGNGRYDAELPAVERFQEIFGNVLDLSPLIDQSGAEQMKYIQEKIGKDGGVAKRIEEVKAEVKRLREERVWLFRSKKDAEALMLDPDFRALVNYVDEQPTDIKELQSKKVIVDEVVQQLNVADKVNVAADNFIVQLRDWLGKVKDEDIKACVANLMELFEAKKIDTTELAQKLADAKEINDSIDEQIKEAEERNKKIEKSVEFKNTKVRITELEADYKKMTEEIHVQLGSISGEIAKLGFSEIYEGLSVEYEMDEEGKVVREGMFLRGKPFNRRNQSYGESIKVLVKLAKALNPDGFNYIKIGDWNLLDEENQEEVIKVAAANDIQLGIEVVGKNKELQIKLIEKE